jgi:hypothetical protein
MANGSSQSICNNWVLNPKSQFLQLNFGKYPIVAVNPNGDKKLRIWVMVWTGMNHSYWWLEELE